MSITKRNTVNDPRIVEYKREIKKLKQKLKLQTELNCQLEKEKNAIQSQLDSYKKRCNDLQKTIDDKDLYLNEALASITATPSCKDMFFVYTGHQKPIQLNKKKRERSKTLTPINHIRSLSQFEIPVFQEYVILISPTIQELMRYDGNKKKTEEKIEEKEELKEEEEEQEDEDEEEEEEEEESSSEESYLLLSDSEQEGGGNNNDEISNNLSNYVELKLVKYGGRGEIYVVITNFDDKKEGIEVFRSDFTKCINIEKNQIEQDFSIYFENITLIFRCDDYEKARTIHEFFKLRPPTDSVYK